MRKKLQLLCTILSLSTFLFGQERTEVELWIQKSRQSMFQNPKQSSYYASQAIALLPESFPNPTRARALLLYCQAEQLLGNFDISITTLYDTQKFIDSNDSQMMGELYSLMGRVYSKLGHFNKAFELNDKATAIFKSLRDSASIASCYNERGVMHHFLNEFSIAEQFFQRALAINRAQRNLSAVAANLNNLCLYQGNTEEKLSFIQEAIAINKNLDAQWSLGENYNNMGKQYYYAKQYDKALDALQKAYDYANGIGAKELICDNYEYQAMIYKDIGNFVKAYRNLEKMYALSSELRSSSQLRNIEQEISNKLYQEQKYAAELKEQAYRIQQLKSNLYLLGCLLLIGVATVLFLYKWYKRRKDLQLMETRYSLQRKEHELTQLQLHQKQLELKNVQGALTDSRQELTSFAVFLRSRNELLDRVCEMLKDGYKMDAQALVPHMKKIRLLIRQSQKGDSVNNPLLTSVEEKSKEFLEHLTEKHPGLTQGEKHLAALLRINLSTKEIAMITDTLPKTINMNRYRLRKSLNLTTEDNLVEYLQKL